MAHSKATKEMNNAGIFILLYAFDLFMIIRTVTHSVREHIDAESSSMIMREDIEDEERGENMRKTEKNVSRQISGIERCHLVFAAIGVKNNKERGKRIVNILIEW